jgi:methylenetetrahydrofolate dehydrogenase (NADP+)/methenyltetrahydrofolate cyclohydrolase
MTAKILDGARVARTIREEVAAEVAALRERGVIPRLDVILVGDDPASQVYVRSKARACERAGIVSETHRLSADVPQRELEELVDRLNGEAEVDGILVQLPLPSGLDSHRVLDRIDPAKDVDGFHPVNVGLLVQNRPRFVACTPVGIMELLDREGVPVEGRRAVVVGRSDIVGKPMAMLLLHRHATVTVCHSRTRDLAAVTREADILVAAAGRLALIGPEHVKPGAVVIDVGIHRITDGSQVERLFPGDEGRRRRFEEKGSVLAGDVDFVRVAEVAGAITPVPGGVGPLTIAMLLANTVASAKRRAG